MIEMSCDFDQRLIDYDDNYEDFGRSAIRTKYHVEMLFYILEYYHPQFKFWFEDKETDNENT